MEYFSYPVISRDEDRYRKCDDDTLLHFAYEMIDLIAHKKNNTPRADQINLICNNKFGMRWFEKLNLLSELSKNEEFSASEEHCKFKVSEGRCIEDKSDCNEYQNSKVMCDDINKNGYADNDDHKNDDTDENADCVNYIHRYNFDNYDNEDSNGADDDDEDYDYDYDYEDDDDDDDDDDHNDNDNDNDDDDDDVNRDVGAERNDKVQSINVIVSFQVYN